MSTDSDIDGAKLGDLEITRDRKRPREGAVRLQPPRLSAPRCASERLLLDLDVVLDALHAFGLHDTHVKRAARPAR